MVGEQEEELFDREKTCKKTCFGFETSIFGFSTFLRAAPSHRVRKKYTLHFLSVKKVFFSREETKQQRQSVINIAKPGKRETTVKFKLNTKKKVLSSFQFWKQSLCVAKQSSRRRYFSFNSKRCHSKRSLQARAPREIV